MTHALQQGAANHPRKHRRRGAAAYVREEHNVPCTEATLATLACRGGGLMFYLFGRIPIYSAEDLDAWVEARMGEPVRSTSEARNTLREPHRKMRTPSIGAGEVVAVEGAEGFAASVPRGRQRPLPLASPPRRRLRRDPDRCGDGPRARINPRHWRAGRRGHSLSRRLLVTRDP